MASSPTSTFSLPAGVVKRSARLANQLGLDLHTQVFPAAVLAVVQLHGNDSVLLYRNKSHDANQHAPVVSEVYLEHSDTISTVAKRLPALRPAPRSIQNGQPAGDRSSLPAVYYAVGNVEPASVHDHLPFLSLQVQQGLKDEVFCQCSGSCVAIEEFFHHLSAVLEAVCDDPTTQLGFLQVLSQHESKHLLSTLQGELRPENVSQNAGGVHRWFEQVVARNPSAPCLHYQGETMTYEQVNRIANVLGWKLGAMGINGLACGILLERSFDLITSILAIWKSGAAYVPLDPAYPDDRLSIYIQDSKAPIIITQRKYQAKAVSLLEGVEHPVSIIVVEDAAEQYMGVHTPPNPNLPFSMEQPCYIIFTSGSTGRPKGVPVLHQGLFDLMKYFIEITQMTDKDVAIATGTINFDAHVIQIYPALLSGAAIVLPRPDGHMDPAHMAELMMQYKVTAQLCTVPSLAAEWLKAPSMAKCAAHMRVFGCGGEAVQPELIKKIYKTFPNLLGNFNFYGPTEFTVMGTAYHCPRDLTAAYLGPVNHNCHGYVVDPVSFRLLPQGVPGELVLAGPRLAAGYMGRPDLTEKAFVENPFYNMVQNDLPEVLRPHFKRCYRTGDLVRWNGDGLLEYLGRIDRQVKVNGVRIELGEVEAALASAPGVTSGMAAASVVKDDAGRSTLVGYVEVDPSGVGAVQQHCRSLLLPAMVPSIFVPMTALPLLPNGKIDYKSLPPPEQPAALNDEEYVAPANDVERVVQGLWMETLQTSDPISVTSDFYRVGGTSLKAIGMAAILKEKYKLAGSNAVLLSATTIRETAALIGNSSNGGTSSDPGIVPQCWTDGWRPLSTAQAQMYILGQQLDLGYLYNESLAQTLTGDLNVKALQAAFQSMVARHEVLRCKYTEQADGTIMLEVLPPSKVPVPFQVVDLTRMDKNSAWRKTDRLEESHHMEPINIATDVPLMRVLLVKVTKKEYRLCVTMHHAVVDGWSLQVLTKEITWGYNKAAGDPGAGNLAPPPVQYADFAAWQQQWLKSPAAKEQLEWWKNNLAGVSELLQLPTDFPRPPVQSKKGNIFGIYLSQELTQSIHQLMKETGSTIVGTCLAAYQLMLGLYSGQMDLLVGIPHSTRENRTHELVGYFLNILPIRATIDMRSTFREYLKSVQKALQGAVAHSDLPMATIVDELQVERSPAYNPLVQCMLTFDEESWFSSMDLYGGVSGSDGRGSGFKFETGVSKVDISLCVVPGVDDEGEPTQYLEFEYSTDLFTEETASRMLENLSTILEAMCTSTDKRMCSVNMMPLEERQKLIVDFQGEPHPEYVSAPPAHQLFEASVSKFSDSPCLIFEGQTMTYKEVNFAANRLARRLVSAGVSSNRVVGLMVDRSFDLVVAIFAVWKAGGAYLPMDASYAVDRLAMYIEDSKSNIVLAQSQHAEKAVDIIAAATGQAQLITMDATDYSDTSAPSHNLDITVNKDQLAYIIFTSGSTGRPKGVQVPHSCLTDFLMFYAADCELTAQDVAVLTTTINFDGHVLQLYPPLLRGGSLVLPRADGHMDPAYMADLMARHKVTAQLFTVPSLATEWIKTPDMALAAPYLRVFSCGGEYVSPELILKLYEVFPNLKINNILYGPTENTVISTLYRTDMNIKLGYLGWPNHNVHAYVVDPVTLQMLPMGGAGELILSGPRVTNGYIGRDDLTEKAFVPNPLYEEVAATLPEPLRPFYKRAYRSGDLCRWTAEGLLEYMGRIDRQVKINGVRIELGEVESTLEAAPGVHGRAIALVVKDKFGRPTLVGYVEANPTSSNAIHDYCKSKLLPAMVPSIIIAMEAFPLLPHGKTDVKALPLPDWDKLAGAGEYVGPRDEYEEEIQKIWIEVLQSPKPISVTADFYKIGGNSMKAIISNSAIKQRFKLQIPANQLIQHTTIASLASCAASHVRKESGEEQVERQVSVKELFPEFEVEDAIPKYDYKDEWRIVSSGQLQMHTLSSMDNLGYQYNSSMAHTLEGRLDVGALQAALDKVVERHEVLRSEFVTTAEGTKSRIRPSSAVNCSIEVVDLTKSSATDLEDKLKREVQQRVHYKFDLAAAPLFRVTLFRLSALRHVLLSNFHHCVTDGWSMGVYMRELSAFYANILDPKRKPPKPRALHYGDYSAWQQEWLASPAADDALEYWKTKLRGAPELLQLPTDRPRPPIWTRKGDRVEFHLSEQTVAKMEQFASANGSTAFTVLIAAFRTLLAWYSNQSDFVLGAAFQMRPPGTHDLIGYFVNTLALRTEVKTDKSFTEAVDAEQATVRGAMAHGDIPFQTIVTNMNVTRSPSYNPLIQALLVVQDAAFSGLSTFPGINSMYPYTAMAQVAHMDIMMMFTPSGKGMVGHAIYNVDIFNATTIERMCDNFAGLLDRLLSHPTAPLQKADLLSASEKQHLLVTLQGEIRPNNITAPVMHQQFESMAASKPNAPCLHYEGTTMTFAQVNNAANLLARRLIVSGVGPDKRVGLMVERSFDLIISMMAIWKAGGGFVPMDPQYPEDRLAIYAEDSFATMVLTQRPLVSKARKTVNDAGLKCDILVYEDEMESARRAGLSILNLNVEIDKSTLAYIIFTSGSTGRPKGVQVLHQGVTDILMFFIEDMKITADDVSILTSTINFDGFVMQMFPTMMVGGKLVLTRPDGHMDPNYIAETMAKYKVTGQLFTVPSLASEWIKVPAMKEAAKYLKIHNVGGEYCSPDMMKKLFQAYPNIEINAICYGPTENTVITTLYKTDPSIQVGYLGPLNYNMQGYVVDPSTLQLLPWGAAGELIMSGPRITNGYSGRPDLTEKAFINNPFYSEVIKTLPESMWPFYKRCYRSGDLCRWTGDGLLEYLGRIDRQVKVNGVRIELGEVEAALESAPGNNGRSAALVLKDDFGRATLVGYAETSEDQIPGIQAHCRSVLLPAMVPSVIVALSTFPILPNGKLDLKSLPPPDWSALAGDSGSYVPPSNPVEETVQRLAMEILAVAEPISVHTDFYRIGGTSLKAIALAAQIKSAYGLQGSTAGLLQMSTIAQMSEYVSKNAAPEMLTTAMAAADVAAGEDAGQVQPVNWMDNWRPLSAGQMQMYILQASDPGCVHYNESINFTLSGNLSISTFEAALNAITQRHELYRCCFKTTPSGPRIWVDDAAYCKVETTDVSHLSKTEAQKKSREILDDVQQRVFDMSKAPLMNVMVVQREAFPEPLYDIMICQHHAINDGWSLGILVKELNEYYNAILSKGNPNLPLLPIQYGDFAHWQDEVLNGPQAEPLVSFWKENLAGVPDLLQMPTDFPRPPVFTYKGAVIKFNVPQSVVAKINHISKSHGTTLFNQVLVAYKLMMAIYSGTPDIVVGSTFSSRPPGTHDLLGYFINVLPIRTDMDMQLPFVKLCANEQAAVRNAMAHSDLPFQRIVEELKVPRSKAYNPLVQAMVSYDDEAWLLPQLKFQGTKPAPNQLVDPGDAKSDLLLGVIPSADGKDLLLILQYASDIFSSVSAEGMVNAIQHILEVCCSNPETPLKELHMVSEAEEQELLTKMHGTMVPENPFRPPVHVLFEQAAQRNPEGPCLIYEGKKMTYSQVNTAANILARQLVGQDVTPGTCIGLMMGRSFDLIISMIAIWKAGATYVPMDPGFPEDRLAIYAEDSGATVVLTQAEHKAKAEDMVHKLGLKSVVMVPSIKVDSVPSATAAGKTAPYNSKTNSSKHLVGLVGVNLPIQVQPNSPAYIIFTSGSTGRPKGVQVPHVALTDLIHHYWRTFKIVQTDVVLQITSINFDPHLLDISTTLAAGACIMMPKPGAHLDPPALVQLLKQHKVTVALSSVPSLVKEYMDSLESSPQESLRVWTLCGEPLPVSLANGLQRVLPNCQVVNAYGPTEVTVNTTSWKVPRPCNAMFIGPPETNVHAYIVDPQSLQLVPRGAAGELILSGPRLAHGYKGRPDLTEKAFVPNPLYAKVVPHLPEKMRPFFKMAYRTGDLCRWNPEGLVEYLGRIDRQVKINGVRIELGEVEAALEKAPGVEGKVAALAMKDSHSRVALVGYVQADASHLPAIQAHCKACLVPAMVPSIIVPLEHFPLLPNGKLDIKSLPPPDWSGAGGGDDYVPATDNIQKIVQEMWMDILNISEPISIRADFFMLGGTSLKSIAVVSKLKERLDLPGSNAALLGANTIEEIAEVIREITGGTMQVDESQVSSTIVRREWYDEWRPLSAGQSQMYILQNQSQDSYHYNESLYYIIEGDLKVDILEGALNAMIQRHEVLRSEFVSIPGEGQRIRINPSAKVKVDLQDLTHLQGSRAEQRAKRFMTDAFTTPFDLSRAPAMTCLVVKRPKKTWDLLLVLHHAVMDGWSLGLIAKEMNDFYNAIYKNVSPALPPLPAQYSDFAAWQTEYLASPAAKKQMDWWMDNLKGLPDILQLPLDRPRPPVPSYEGGFHLFECPLDVVASVQAAIRKLGTTLFNFLLLSYKLLLSSYSGQTDITVSSSFATRPPGTHDLIGYFLNILPLRTQLDPTKTFKELVAQEQKMTREAMANSDIPFQQIFEGLNISRGPYNTLIQTSITIDEESWFPPLQFEGCERARDSEFDVGIAKTDILFAVTPSTDGKEFLMLLQYNADIFSEATIAEMSDALIGIMDAVAGQPDVPIVELDMLSKKQNEMLFDRFQGELHPEYIKSPYCHQLFEHMVDKQPDHPCVVYENVVLTYAQTNIAANILARRLVTQGVKPGVVVGVLMERSQDVAVAMLAIWKAGGAYVPMDVTFPEDRLAIYAEDSKAKLLLTQPQHNAQAIRMSKSLGCSVIVVQPQTPASLPKAVNRDCGNLNLRIDAQQLAYVLFTSGSTGRPKGVQIPHIGFADFLCHGRDHFGFGRSDTVLWMITLNFDPHLSCVMYPLAFGGTMVVVKSEGHKDVAYVAGLLHKWKVTTTMSVPSLAIEYIQDESCKEAIQKYMKNWFIGGEAMPPELVRRVQEAMPNVDRCPINVYGPTEVTISCTSSQLPKPCLSINIGGLDYNMQGYVVDPATMKAVPRGAFGELLLSGPRLALGYIQRPDLTANAFINNPFYHQVANRIPESMQQYYERCYRTGDLCRWTHDGNLEIFGRIDRQVKVNGVRIELGEVEAALASAPGVGIEVASLVLKDSKQRPTLVGYVQCPQSNLVAVRSHCKKTLLPAMVPSVIVAMEEWPRLPNGKLDLKSLPEPDWAALASGDAYVAPRTSIETDVQKIWMELLEVSDPISIETDFYKVGGTSMKNITLASMIVSRSQLTCSSAPLMQLSTIAEMAAFVELQKGEEDSGDMAESSSRGAQLTTVSATKWPDEWRPVSSGQQQMFFFQDNDPKSITYNEVVIYTLVGNLDLDKLEAAFNHLVERHEVLRSQAVMTDTGFKVKVVKKAPMLFEYKDLSHLSDAGALEKSSELVAGFHGIPFDFKKPPPMRVMVVSRRNNSYIIALIIHHGAMDGWSMGIIGNEVAAAYNALVAGRRPAQVLPPMVAQYPDFADWQNKLLAGKAADRLVGFWRDALAEAPELHKLPTDKERPKRAKESNGANFAFAATGSLAKQLDEITKSCNTTMFNVILTAYKLMVAQRSGCPDVIIGSSFSPRPSGTEGMIGYFVSMLPLRTIMDMEMSFKALMAQEHKAMRDAMAHSDIPFTSIVAKLKVKRSTSYNPIVQLSITSVDNSWQPTLELDGCEPGDVIELFDPAVSKMDLLLNMMVDRNGDVQMGWQYNTDLFYEKTIESMSNELLAILDAVSRDAFNPLASVLEDMMSPSLSMDKVIGSSSPRSTREHQLQSFQGDLHPEYMDYPLCYQQFEDIAKKYPELPALIYEGQSMSYSEVNAAANRFARKLLAEGVDTGVTCGVMLERSFNLIISILGIWKAGGVYVPMDPTYPEDRLAVYVEDSKAAVVLSQDKYKSKAQKMLDEAGLHSTVMINVDEVMTGGQTTARNSANLNHSVSKDDLAYIIFTSGSTGRPKGVQLPHVAFGEFLAHGANTYGLGPGDAYLLTMTVNFDPHMAVVMYPLTTGAALLISKPDGHTDPHYIGQLMLKHKVSGTISVPTLAAEYIKDSGVKQAAPFMKSWIIGGEALPVDLVNKMHALFPNLVGPFNAYGPTEATIIATGYWCPKPCDEMFIGRPDHNMHAYVVDPETLQLVPTGESGELWLSGPRLAHGYIGRPDQTAKTFINNPFYNLVESRLPEGMRQYYKRVYRTGDRVKWTNDGLLEYIGRIDRQVKVNGVRIELGEVEAALQTAPGVQMACAAGVKNDRGQYRLVGYVIPDTLSVQSVRKHCQEKVLPAMVPQFIIAMDSFPLLPNGKIDMRALPTPEEAASRSAAKKEAAAAAAQVEPHKRAKGVGFADEVQVAPKTAAADRDFSPFEVESPEKSQVSDGDNKPSTSSGFLAPGNALETAIMQVWMDVLEIKEPIGSADDFFDLGGTSLQAGLINARLRTALDVPNLPGTAIFENPTIATLAQYINDEFSLGYGNSVPDPGDSGLGSAVSGVLEGATSALAGATSMLASMFTMGSGGNKGDLSKAWSQDVNAKVRAKAKSVTRSTTQVNDKLLMLAERVMGMNGQTLTPRSQQLKQYLKFVHRTSLPHVLYNFLQYMLSALVFVAVPMVFAGVSLILVIAWRRVGTYWMLLILITAYPFSLVGAALVLLIMKWLLLLKLRPGAYPVHGTFYARWVAVHTLYNSVMPLLAPFIKRTPLLNIYLRLLGCQIGHNVIIDTVTISDWDMIDIGSNTMIHTGARISGSFIIAEDRAADRPAVLFLTKTIIGSQCEVGQYSNISAGCPVPDRFHLKPALNSGMPNALGPGLNEECPCFVPEAYQYLFTRVLTGIFSLFACSLTLYPGIIVAIVVVQAILGLSVSRVVQAEPGQVTVTLWQAIGISLLFIAFSTKIITQLMAITQRLTLWGYKRLILGTLRPGKNVRHMLSRYALWRRLLEWPGQSTFNDLWGDTFVGTFDRWVLGLNCGKSVFAGGLTVYEHESVYLGDYMDSGGGSIINCVELDGTIRDIKIGAAVTLGNFTMLYPGSVVGPRTVVGSNTMVKRDQQVPPDSRLQGQLAYSVAPRRQAAAVQDDAEKGQLGAEIEEEKSNPNVVLKAAKQAGGALTKTFMQRMQEDVQAKNRMSDTVNKPKTKMPTSLGHFVIDELVTVFTKWVFNGTAMELIYCGLVLVILYLISSVKGGFWWLLLYFPLLVPLYIIAVLYVRLMTYVFGIANQWRKGKASVWSIRVKLSTGIIAPSTSALTSNWIGTPILNVLMRMLGAKIGKRVLFLGEPIAEMELLDIGDHVVLEQHATAGGHFLKAQEFNYLKPVLEDWSWLQSCCTMQAGCKVEEHGRLMPGSNLLPGETIVANQVWDGIPARPVG